MSKCIKCGRELTSAEIPEFYNGMCEKCHREQNFDEYPFKQCIYDYQNLINQLKQQLAEKDKEIANLQVLIIENKNDVKEMREFKIGDNDYDLTDEDARNDIKCQIEHQTQLAIQELEKVKDTLKHFCNIHNDEYYGVKAEVKGIELDVCESIDYQIKVLKGE